MKKLILCLMSLSVCLISYGQTDVRSRGSGTGTDQPAQPQQGQKRYSGRILDQNGQPVVGATISVVDAAGKTVAGTYTDADGNYSVSAAPGLKLKVSSVSYTATETTLGESETLNYTLQEESTLIEEVVVVGYGTQTKREVTGAITTIKGDDMAGLITPNVIQQLQGRAAGLQVSLPSGLLGQEPRVRVRGTNSVSLSGNPLYVVDNVPFFSGNGSGVFFNNPLSDINPSDIESVEILKDGAATALWGSRANNGVILITTKRGKSGRAQVNYEFVYGFSEITRKMKVLNADEFRTIKNESRANSSLAPAAFNITDANGNTIVDTDWQGQIFQRGPQSSQSFSVSGGNDKTSYYFSLGYLNQIGAIVRNSFESQRFRANIDHKANKWLDAGISLGVTRGVTNGLNVGGNALSGNVRNALNALPNVPIYNADGSFATSANASTPNPNIQSRGNNTLPQATSDPNIRYVLDLNKYTTNNYTMYGNFYFDIHPLPYLRFRTQLGAQLLLNEDHQFLDSRQGDGFNSAGIVIKQFSPSVRWNWQNTLTFDKTFLDAHKVTATVGYEAQFDDGSSFFAQGQGIVDPAFYNLVSNSFTTQLAGGGRTRSGFEALLGRVNYGYKGKYLFQASIRRDGLSNLASGRRYGVFPGIGLGWVVSEESFFKNASFLSVVNSLKLRTSYGVTGNQVGGFPALTLAAPALYGNQGGINPNSLGNPNITWETSRKFDIGVETSLLKDRLFVEFDYYRNEITDLVQFVATPASLGIPQNGYTFNVGSMLSDGIELRVRATVMKKAGFTWETDFNFNTNRNRVTKLNAGQDIASGAFNVVREGEPVGAFIGFQNAGVNPTNGFPLWRNGAGEIIMGNPTTGNFTLYNPEAPGTVGPARNPLGAADRVLLGNPNPTYFGGITNRFSYKGFDLDILIIYSGGNKILNVTRQSLFSQQFLNNHADILGRWTPGNTVTDIPRLFWNSQDFVNNNNNAASRWVEIGDFLRIQNVTLGYSLPKDIIDRVGITRFRLFAQVQNLATFTKYSGFDPEANSGGGNNANGIGTDQNVNPQVRTYSFGFNISF